MTSKLVPGGRVPGLGQQFLHDGQRYRGDGWTLHVKFHTNDVDHFGDFVK